MGFQADDGEGIPDLGMFRMSIRLDDPRLDPSPQERERERERRQAEIEAAFFQEPAPLEEMMGFAGNDEPTDPDVLYLMRDDADAVRDAPIHNLITIPASEVRRLLTMRPEDMTFDDLFQLAGLSSAHSTLAKLWDRVCEDRGEVDREEARAVLDARWSED